MNSGPDTGLIERDDELEALARLVRDAAGGDARFVMIEGPAGIGKSQLLAEARLMGRAASMNVLPARGSELEREFPYGVVRQLFEAQLVDPDARRRLLTGAAETAAPIFGAMDGASEDVSFAALHGLYWLTVNLAGEQPLMLAVDDLHWADRPSMRFLAYLSSRLEGNALLVTAGLRPSEPGTDAVLIGEIMRDPLCVPLRPSGLSMVGTGLLVTQRLGRDADPAFSAECHTATGGNPFLLTELLRALDAEGVAPSARSAAAVAELGPRAVSRGVLLRLSRVPGDGIAVARTLAVLGDGADLARLAHLAGLGITATADAIGHLARAEIVRPDPPLGFVHPLVREAIYLDIGPGERQRLHSEAAQLLHDAGAPAEYVAAQLMETGRSGQEWAVDALDAAADQALTRGAPDSAVAYLRRMLEESPSEARYVNTEFRLAMAASHVDGLAGIAYLEDAYERATEQAMRDAIGVQLVHLKFYTRPQEGVPVAERAARELAPDKRDAARQLEAGRLCLAWVDDHAVSLDDPGFTTAAALSSGEAGLGARMLEGVAAYQASLFDAPADTAADLALRAVADGELTLLAAATIPWIAAVDTLITADRDEALDVLAAGEAQAHRAGSGFIMTGVHGFGARCLTMRGDLQAALDRAQTARSVHDAWGGFTTVRAPAGAFMVRVLTEQGRLADARANLAWIGLSDTPPWGSVALHYLYDALLRLAVAEGDWTGAVELSLECEGRFPRLNPARLPWRSLRAEALYGLGDTSEAVALAEAELPHASAWGAPRTVGRSLRILGVVTRDLAPIREAVALLEGSPAKLELAKALTDEGTLLRLSRHPTEARDPLHRALELATVCGATALAERVRTELGAAGFRTRSEAMTGVGALTPSERRVAEAAAQGQSNKDIAQALYVTPKTIEVHLSNAYRKLGIRSRRELVGALAA